MEGKKERVGYVFRLQNWAQAHAVYKSDNNNIACCFHCRMTIAPASHGVGMEGPNRDTFSFLLLLHPIFFQTEVESSIVFHFFSLFFGVGACTLFKFLSTKYVKFALIELKP